MKTYSIWQKQGQRNRDAEKRPSQSHEACGYVLANRPTSLARFPLSVYIASSALGLGSTVTTDL